MDKQKLYNLVLDNMLDKCKSNVVVSRVRKGSLTLGLDKSTVEVVDPGGNKHYLVHVGDVVYLKDGGKVELHGNVRNAIAKAFISKYTYDDVLKYYDSYINGIKLKIEEANKTKYLLEGVASKIAKLSNLKVEPVILTDNIQYKYYVKYSLGLSNSIEIYLSEDKGVYRCRYNGNWLNLNATQLESLILDMVSDCKKELKKKDEYNLKRMSEEQKVQMLDDFVDKVWYSNKEVIVKLKSGYQCISRGRRYSVGTGKEGKFFKVPTWQKLRDYIEQKGINEYYILGDGDNTCSFTDDVLKKLPYSKIIG